MGGQLEYFGFWVDAEYGKGKCSPSCTTYNSPQLSSSPEFLIDRIEVWAVGPEPVKDEEETVTYILPFFLFSQFLIDKIIMPYWPKPYLSLNVFNIFFS